MSANPPAVAENPQDEIAALVRTLHETQERLQELAGGEVDAVVHPSGHSYLLHEAQEKLRFSETAQHDLAATQAAILNALPAHIALLDAQGVILTVNESWRQFAIANALQGPAFGLGVNYVEVCERSCGACAEEAQAAAAGIRKLLRGAVPNFTLEYPCHSPTEQRWFRLMVTPLSDRQQAGAVVMHVNITERKLAELKLRESEERLRLTVAASNIGLWDWNLRTNEVIFSREWKCQLGYAEDEIANAFSEWESRVHPDDLPEAKARLERYLARPEGTHEVEFRMRHKDGSWRWILARGEAEQDSNGQINRMLGSHLDITARKLAEARMEEQAAFLDAAHEAILAQDPNDIIRYWNKGAEQTYGWTAAEALGRKSRELLGHDEAKFLEASAILLAKGQWQGEVTKRTKDGRELTVEASWTLVRDARGQPKSILAIDSDITDKKKLETQFFRAQRMESIGTLAGGIAHDLNNVLAPILMSVQVLRLTAVKQEDLELLNTLESSCQRGADLVKQVLSFARGVEGQRLPVNPAHLIRELVRVMKETFPKNIAVHFTPTRDLWTVPGDPTQLHQVFLNLCVNARDAMPQGGSLTITLANLVLDETYAGMNPESKPGPHVVIQVTDTGTGIPVEIREKIFEPFFTTKEIGKGTGLGLATTLAIVKGHGGFINLYSEVGKGTTFKVYLPASPTQAATPQPAAEPVRLLRGHGEMVLVVDDEEVIRDIARRTLEHFGYRVLLATQGAEAIALYAQHQPEVAVVLTDMAMPIMDGPTLIVALKAINPQVKIIGSSGLAANDGVTRAVGAGVVHFVPKPYSAETLLRTLHEALQGAAPSTPADQWIPRHPNS